MSSRVESGASAIASRHPRVVELDRVAHPQPRALPRKHHPLAIFDPYKLPPDAVPHDRGYDPHQGGALRAVHAHTLDDSPGDPRLRISRAGGIGAPHHRS